MCFYYDYLLGRFRECGETHTVVEFGFFFLSWTCQISTYCRSWLWKKDVLRKTKIKEYIWRRDVGHGVFLFLAWFLFRFSFSIRSIHGWWGSLAFLFYVGVFCLLELNSRYFFWEFFAIFCWC